MKLERLHGNEKRNKEFTRRRHKEKRRYKVDRLLRRRCLPPKAQEFHSRRSLCGGKAAQTPTRPDVAFHLNYDLALNVITSRNMRRLSRKKLTLLPSAWFQRTGISRIRRPARCARKSSSTSNAKPWIRAASRIGRHASSRNALNPHCVSQNGNPVVTRTSRLKTRPACSRRQ